MKKTERQAGSTETLTQRQMNTQRNKNNSLYEWREEEGYKNVKSNNRGKKRLIEQWREEKKSDRHAISHPSCSV